MCNRKIIQFINFMVIILPQILIKTKHEFDPFYSAISVFQVSMTVAPKSVDNTKQSSAQGIIMLDFSSFTQCLTITF